MLIKSKFTDKSRVSISCVELAANKGARCFCRRAIVLAYLSSRRSAPSTLAKSARTPLPTEKTPKGANRARRQCNSQRILCAREFSLRDILSLINIKLCSRSFSARVCRRRLNALVSRPIPSHLNLIVLCICVSK